MAKLTNFSYRNAQTSNPAKKHPQHETTHIQKQIVNTHPEYMRVFHIVGINTTRPRTPLSLYGARESNIKTLKKRKTPKHT